MLQPRRNLLIHRRTGGRRSPRGHAQVHQARGALDRKHRGHPKLRPFGPALTPDGQSPRLRFCGPAAPLCSGTAPSGGRCGRGPPRSSCTGGGPGAWSPRCRTAGGSWPERRGPLARGGSAGRGGGATFMWYRRSPASRSMRYDFLFTAMTAWLTSRDPWTLPLRTWVRHIRFLKTRGGETPC